MPSLCMNYQSTFTLSPEAGATGTWEFDATLVPHPISFIGWERRTSVGTTAGVCLNSQLEGDDHSEKYTSWKSLAQRWRLAYMAVTVYQDGPDLANQGTLVVCQPPVSPRSRCLSAFSRADNDWKPPVCGMAKTCEWTTEDMPDYTRSQAMPSAYYNKSKEGAYVPLKLTDTCQDWFSENDEITVGEFSKPVAAPDDVTGTLALTNSNLSMFPFYDLENVMFVTTDVNTGYWRGQATSPPLSGNWAHICARNLSTTTSYSFFVRCGVEMQVSPSSTLSPQLKLSPPYDPVALTTYFQICRELKDAYPADYNTTGKLWGVIKQALNALDPVITVMPGSKVVKPLVTAGVAAGDIVVAKRKKRRQKKKAKKRAVQQVVTVRRKAPPPPSNKN